MPAPSVLAFMGRRVARFPVILAGGWRRDGTQHNEDQQYEHWTYWELLKEDRRWGKHPMPAEEIRFEIERRHRNWKTI